MKQNIYDNTTFFEGYYQLRKTESGLNNVLEGPAFRSLLPDVKNKTVLDLGCGFGDNCFEIIKRGAEKATGMDISDAMLKIARERYAHPQIRFIQNAMEDFAFREENYDLVMSSLAFHYAGDYAALAKHIYRSLRPDGYLIFSVEHPMCTARSEQQWIKDENGKELFCVVDNYRDEGVRDTNWFVNHVLKYHRTVETYVNTLTDTGFKIRRLREPESPSEFRRKDRTLMLHSHRPPFLLLSAQK